MACLTLIYFKSAMSLSKAIELYRDALVDRSRDPTAPAKIESELQAAEAEVAAGEGLLPRSTTLPHLRLLQ